MISEREKEQIQIDAQRYIFEQKREALTTIVPHPDEIEKRIELIALLSGRRPNIRELFLADVEQEGWIALSKGQNPDLQTMDAIRFIHTNSTSLDGTRSKQVVEIARSETPMQGKAILDMLTRGRAKT